MARHGQAAWPLKPSCWLCVLVCLSPAWLRAETPALPPQSRSGGAQAPDPVEFVLAQAGPFTAARRIEPAEPAAAQRSSVGFLDLIFPSGPRQLAPIRWRGKTGFEYRMTREERVRRGQMVEFADLEMATYVGQPWLVQVQANLGFVADQQRERGDEDVSVADGRRGSVNILGGAGVTVFPRSRFPFTASFNVSDTRANEEATAADYASRRFTLRQAYRSPLGDQIYSGNIDHSTLISDSFGRDTLFALGGSMQRPVFGQVVHVNGSYARNRRSDTDSASDVGQLTARHTWRPTDLATVESFAAFSSNAFESGAVDNQTRFFQLNSFGTWRPDEESPYFVTGGVRMADARASSGGDETTTRTIGANVAASYAISPHASLTAAATIAGLQGEEETTVVSTQTVAANYSPGPIALGPVAYSWGTSASASNQTGGSGEAETHHALAAQANHQVSSGVALGSIATLQGSINQSGAVLQDSVQGLTQTLSHSGSVGLRVAPTTGSDAFFSVNVGDSRSTGAREDHFQLLNVQLTGSLRLGFYSVLSANFTGQAVRQQREEKPEPETTVTRSGTISYQHMRVMGVPRLRFIATATFNDQALESRALGDVEAPREQYTRLFEARLDYDIGRMQLRLGTRLAKTEGSSNSQIFFRLNRNFGLF